MSETYEGQDSNQDDVEAYPVLLAACTRIVADRDRKIAQDARASKAPLPEIVVNLVQNIFDQTGSIQAANILAMEGIEVVVDGKPWEWRALQVQYTLPTKKITITEHEDLAEMLTRQGLTLDTHDVPPIRKEFYAEADRPDFNES